MKILPNSQDAVSYGKTGAQGLQNMLASTGRFPPVGLIVKPLDGGKEINLTRFLSYNFTSSILIPVDTFNFSYVAPDSPKATIEYIKDGDIVVLTANNQPLATGIIDNSDIEVDNEFGEKGELGGRDLLSQLEDNDAISLDSTPIYASGLSIEAAVNKLLTNTRIRGVRLRGAPSGSKWLLATEPGESKLAALQRFLEPLNCLAWMDPDGYVVIGKPNMAQDPIGRLILSKSKRKSNVLSMKAARSSTRIPGAIVPVWSAQEDALNFVSKSQALLNGAPGPSRLYKLGHRVIKTVVVSTPQGADPQSLSQINGIAVANYSGNTGGGGPILNAYAKREMARANQQELIVQCVVPGHYNNLGEPFKVDTVYAIEFDRANVFENMYLFQVDYSLSLDKGQVTSLFFCKLGTIVSDVVAPGSSR